MAGEEPRVEEKAGERSRVDERAGERSRVDERALGAGTTARFALLVVLLLASSSLMALYVGIALTAYDGFGCSLAAGVAPDADAAATVMAKRMLQWESYQACTERYAPPPPWWVLVGWWAVLAGLTAVLFLVLPAWKGRPSRVVPLVVVDRDGEIARAVSELATVAGLARRPRVLVDPTVRSAGAVVFGRTGRATVRLDGGLVATRTTDPRRFRAVLLHELAHIANRDVTITYLTVAVWRVYVVVALPPFLTWCLAKFWWASESVWWPSEAPIVTRGLLLTGLLGVLVYLARSDVLRSREVYADLAAVRWGADPAGWSAPAPEPVPGTGPAVASALAVGRGRWALRAFAELWRTHPRWDVRRAALTDPAVLFGVRALPLVLTGLAAAVIHTHVAYALTLYTLQVPWLQHGAALLCAGLIAGVVGIALWRAVVYAALTGQRAPASFRAGLWLGLGMAAGSAVAGQGTVNEWLPARLWVFGFVVLAALAFTWWLTRCAQLWVAAWRGRSLRGVALLNVSAGALALSLWFLWWQGYGVAFAAGWSFDLAGARDNLVSYLMGRELDHPPASWLDRVYVVVSLTANTVTNPPLAPLAVAGLWLAPLLAWLPRPGVEPPRWARDAAPGDEPAPLGPPPPGLRRVLGSGLLGGVVGGAAAAVALAGLHARQQNETSGTAFMVAYLAGMLAALLVGAAVAAVAARLAAPAHRLPAALVAAGAAVLLGFAALAVLRASDGCVPALTIAGDSCRWNAAVLGQLFTTVLLPALPCAAVVAGVIALPPARAARRPGRPGSTALARTGALTLAVAALAVVAVAGVQKLPYAGRMPTPAEFQRSAQRLTTGTDDAPVSARSRALQVQAWRDRGGGRLMDRFYHARRDLFAAVTTAVEQGRAIDKIDDVRPFCVEISDFARAADRFFRVPDPQAHELWNKFVVLARRGSQGCQQALDADRAAQFNTAMGTLRTAQDTSHAIDDRIDALIRGGGL